MVLEALWEGHRDRPACSPGELTASHGGQTRAHVRDPDDSCDISSFLAWPSLMLCSAGRSMPGGGSCCCSSLGEPVQASQALYLASKALLTASATARPEDQRRQAATRDLFAAMGSALDASLSHGPEDPGETNASQVGVPGWM